MVLSFGKQRPLPSTEAVNAPREPRLQTFRPLSRSPYRLYHPASGRGWWLRPGENTIGRGLDNDIVMTDLSISRNHAKIIVEGSVLTIKDTKSTNGVFVAGERVKHSSLHLDALFRLGNVELSVTRPSMDARDDDIWSRAWD